MKLFKILTVFVFSVVLTFSFSGISQAYITHMPGKEAQDKGYYEVDVKPGDVKKFDFYIENPKKSPARIYTYPADPRPQINGGKASTFKNQSLSEAGTWIKEQGVKEHIMKAGEKKKITYTVKVPNDLKPGKYIAISGVEEEVVRVDSQPKEGDSAVFLNNIDGILSVQMVMNYLPEKATHSMTIDDYRLNYSPSGESVFNIFLTNKGTILEQPDTRIIVTKKDKKVVFSQSVKAKSIYNNTTATMEYRLGNIVLLPDLYSIYYEASFAGKKVSRTFSFEVTEEGYLEAIKDAAFANGEKNWFQQLLDNKVLLLISLLSTLILLSTLVLLIIILFRRRKKKDENNSFNKKEIKM
jgi:hypothetical protein